MTTYDNYKRNQLVMDYENMSNNDKDLKPSSEGEITLVPFLTVVRGSEKGLAKAITKKRFIVGRKVGDFLITDTKVSSAHFAIEAHKMGHMLIDLESTNGTLLNSQKIKMTLLKSGDEIEVGATIIKFTMEKHKDIVGYIDDVDTGRHQIGAMADDNAGITGTGPESPGTERISFDQKQCMISMDGKLFKCMLKIREGFNAGEEFTLAKERTVIGRVSADINLEDKLMLRKHALIEIANNEVSIRDLSSEEGIYVNDRRIHNCRLKGGEKIQLGGTILELTLEEA